MHRSPLQLVPCWPPYSSECVVYSARRRRFVRACVQDRREATREDYDTLAKTTTGEKFMDKHWLWLKDEWVCEQTVERGRKKDKMKTQRAVRWVLFPRDFLLIFIRDCGDFFSFSSVALRPAGCSSFIRVRGRAGMELFFFAADSKRERYSVRSSGVGLFLKNGRILVYFLLEEVKVVCCNELCALIRRGLMKWERGAKLILMKIQLEYYTGSEFPQDSFGRILSFHGMKLSVNA